MVVLEERVADGQQAETSQWRRAIKGTSGLFDNRAATHTHTQTRHILLNTGVLKISKKSANTVS